ncbi:hypothetical protein H2200_005549 [Cladophialophora chaetospira]|uniref:F-box domain-containing protein n=1 Tax=Cladophialophora chaetospira TaxID=386627 RepID=A0AA39CJQ0_9EURO|nr:hypothetical protein H2200_005549 [Cladophialophora chaetospira]
MPRTIQDLPPEVLRLVLTDVRTWARRDRSKAFLNAITTCRLWSDIGVSLLWTDVSLSGSQLFKFTKTGIPQTHAQRVRSLSIKVPTYESWQNHVSSSWYDAAATIPQPFTHKDVWTALRLLPEKLGLMTNMSCFSFVVPSLFDEDGSCCVQRQDIVSIIRSLPSSVRHLELDTNCLELIFQVSTPDLCDVIRELMKTLSNLRLRTGHLCPALFSPGPDSIGKSQAVTDREDVQKTIIISAVAKYTEEGWLFGSCKPRMDRTHGLIWDEFDDANQLLGPLISHAEASIQQGNLRNVTRMSIFDLQSPGYLESDLKYEAVNERVIAPAQKLMKYPCKREEENRKSFLRYLDSDGVQQDVCGMFRDIEEIAEGKVWVETEDGCRLPREYHQSESRFDTKPLRASTVEELNEDVVPKGYGSLFRKEKVYGGTLLPVQESDDLQKVGHLTRSFDRQELRYKAEFEAKQVTGSELQRKMAAYCAKHVGINIHWFDRWSGK